MPEAAEERAPDDRSNGRALAVAIGLAAAGVAPPILAAIVPSVRDLIRPPLAADILLALLILAPAAVGLAVALSGLPRIAASLQRDADDAEHAILRIFTNALLFACTLGWVAGLPAESLPVLALPVAAIGLVAAWALLLWVIVWGPVSLRLRRRCATALDIALLSGFLHLGGAATAGLYPLYLIMVFYAGYRFGERALIEAAICAVAGFAVVVLSTEIWRGQPELAAGLTAALVVLPGCVVGLLRATAASRQAATAAEAGKGEVLAIVAEALRPPLAVILAGPAEPSTRILAERINDVLDVVAVETGQFQVAVEPFDLRALIGDTIAQLSLAATEKGITVRWRIDPRLPPCVRGPSQAIARILASLAGHFVAFGGTGGLRIALDTIDRAADCVTLRLRIDAQEVPTQEPVEENQAAAWQHEALTVGVVTRLVALIGGELSIEGGPGPPSRFVVTLALDVERGATEADLDLRGQPVLIVSGDEAFADEVTGLLDRWHADARWVGDTDAATVEKTELSSGARAVVIVDGRDSPLAALAFAENLGKQGPDAPLTVFVGESSRIERLIELDEAALDCLLPVPLTERLVANAFRSLSLTAHAKARDPGSWPVAGDPAEPRNQRVTPIAVHPKFAPEMPPVLDLRAVEGLRALGGGDAFLRELIDSFHTDAEQLLQRLNEAVTADDAAGFAQAIVALRRCAGHLGGRRLCDMLPPSGDIGAAELRRSGALHIRGIAAEVDRLNAALQGCLQTRQAQGA